MSYRYSFEKLAVWQDAKILALKIYQETTNFPDEEKYGLIAQMRRSAISVCSNLAEGSSRNTNRDQAHFYTMAYSSLMELLNQSIIAEELTFLNQDNFHDLRSQIESVSYKISNLKKSLSKD